MKGATADATLTAGRYDTLRDLGSLGPVHVQVAIDPSPWELPIDTLVISVGPLGLGQLGYAIGRAHPDTAWETLDLAEVTPEVPQRLVLEPDDAGQGRTSLRQIILATAREVEGTSWVGEPPATLEAIRRATASAIELALAHDTRSLGLPLLGAGAIGFPNNEVAFEVVRIARPPSAATPPTGWATRSGDRRHRNGSSGHHAGTKDDAGRSPRGRTAWSEGWS